MAQPRPLVRLFATLTAVMFVPPVIAGVFGGLGLAVVVGVLSIFVGLVGMSLVVGKSELLPKRQQMLLPKARVVDRD